MESGPDHLKRRGPTPGASGCPSGPRADRRRVRRLPDGRCLRALAGSASWWVDARTKVFPEVARHLPQCRSRRISSNAIASAAKKSPCNDGFCCTVPFHWQQGTNWDNVELRANTPAGRDARIKPKTTKKSYRPLASYFSLGPHPAAARGGAPSRELGPVGFLMPRE